MNKISALASLSQERMESFAQGLAILLLPGDTLTLSGEIGAGKTCFARALISTIAVGAPEVTSPTFTLMQSYEVTSGALWHLDLYRLEYASELEALGLDELWDSIVLIEWPDIAQGLLPKARLDIGFAFGDSTETRTLTLSGNDAWRDRLAQLICGYDESL